MNEVTNAGPAADRPKGFAAVRRFVKMMFKAFAEDQTFDLGAALA